ncbi:hypothetical protein T09_1780 [Trichinella sp. T9]|nr:hypothetical protein T09_1780 [Trichinella sp. T9]
MKPKMIKINRKDRMNEHITLSPFDCSSVMVVRK